MGPEEEFQKFDSEGSWSLVYGHVCNEASVSHDFSLNDSRRAEFRSRNRYRDVSPYDHSRVRLDRDGIDYINASLVKAPEANRSYILTQGPLPATCGHFWLMVWEQNSKAVLMLNRVVERGRLKCDQYFPTGAENEGEDEKVYEDVDLKVSFLQEYNMNYFKIRTLLMTDLRTGDSKEVLQFHYTTWPDFGVPESPAAFLNFLLAVRQSGALDPDVGPPVIHCSAGIGRSGTFCLVDTCLVLIEKNQDKNCVNVCDVLMDMRKYRMGLIQTPDQLRFSYLAIIEGSARVLSESPDSGFNEVTGGSAGSENSAPLDTSALLFTPPSPPINGHSPHQLITSIDDVDEEVPPPLPKRRSKRSPDIVSDTDVIINNINTGDGDLPSVLDGYLGVADSSKLPRTSSTSTELRRRKREERVKNTASQIEKMKQKQKESEKWRGRKTKWRPWIIGAAASLLLGSILIYRYYWS